MTIDENQNDQSVSRITVPKESETKPPFGISLLSIAVILFNLWILISLLAQREKLTTGNGLPIYETPISANYFIILCFICIIGITVGATFWLGKSWSWWIFIFWCFYELLATIKSLILLIVTSNFSVYIVERASFIIMGICVMALVILHLFENSTFRYYNLNENKKLRYSAYLAVAAVIGVALQSLLQA